MEVKLFQRLGQQHQVLVSVLQNQSAEDCFSVHTAAFYVPMSGFFLVFLRDLNSQSSGSGGVFVYHSCG